MKVITLPDKLTNRDRLIQFVEELNFSERDSNWHCSMSISSHHNTYELTFIYTHSHLINVSIHYYNTPDTPENNGVNRVIFSTTDDRDRSVTIYSTEFSKTFNNKVLGWFEEATGVNEPDDDEEWFIKELN